MWVEQKYIQLISSRLQNFKKKSNRSWNFRCPFCGDSHKHVKKSRGYILENKGNFRYYCHKCTKSLSFNQFLKSIDGTLYDEFRLEKFKETSPKKIKKKDNYFTGIEKTVSVDNTILNSIPKIDHLEKTHSARNYLLSRGINSKWFGKLYYAENFDALVQKFSKNKEVKTLSRMVKEPRIVIPLYDQKNFLIGFQGRSLKKNSIKYLTILFDDNNPKIFNLNNVDFNKRFYVTEGPFDSMFLNNSIATLGGDLISELKKHLIPKENCVIIYDNEPRSRFTIKKLERAIEDDYKVFIWPTDIKEKDINDLIISLEPMNFETKLSYIQNMINNNTFSGIEATLQLQQWKKYETSVCN